MRLQTSQSSLSGGRHGRGSLEISAYRACNAVGFFQVFEKAEELRSRRIRDRKLGAPRRQRLLSGLRPARLRDRFAAERRRLDRYTIQDEESHETTTRPLKRGSSTPSSSSTTRRVICLANTTAAETSSRRRCGWATSQLRRCSQTARAVSTCSMFTPII